MRPQNSSGSEGNRLYTPLTLEIMKRENGMIARRSSFFKDYRDSVKPRRAWLLLVTELRRRFLSPALLIKLFQLLHADGQFCGRSIGSYPSRVGNIDHLIVGPEAFDLVVGLRTRRIGAMDFCSVR